MQIKLLKSIIFILILINFISCGYNNYQTILNINIFNQKAIYVNNVTPELIKIKELLKCNELNNDKNKKISLKDKRLLISKSQELFQQYYRYKSTYQEEYLFLVNYVIDLFDLSFDDIKKDNNLKDEEKILYVKDNTSFYSGILLMLSYDDLIPIQKKIEIFNKMNTNITKCKIILTENDLQTIKQSINVCNYKEKNNDIKNIFNNMIINLN